MLFNITIAAFMIVVTTGIHSGGMILVMHGIRRSQGRSFIHRLQQTHYWVSVIVLLMFLLKLLEALLWALVYLALNAIQGFERALYFSMVTFTTLGYGDIVIDERWRLLASFEAANGIIMFGWTTAIVVATVQRIYVSKEPECHNHVDSGNK